MAPENLARFRSFLESAIPYYEQPGGIKVSLLSDPSDATRFIELVEYASEEDYARDQARVEEDPRMRELLEEWRGLLLEPPQVEVWVGE